MSTLVLPAPPPVTDIGNSQMCRYKLRKLSSRVLQKIKNYVTILAAKRIERRDLKYSHGTTTMSGLNGVLQQIVHKGSDAFKQDVAEMRIHLDTEIDFGDFKMFHTAYDCQRKKCELELIILYARKKRVNNVVVVDYMMATYLHKRQQNEASKIAGTVIATIGGVAVFTGCFLAGPVGWAAIGAGGITAAAGLGTAISGTDDKITDKHGEDIEAGVIGHMLEIGLATQVGTDLYLEFEE